jgi:hypothetical protein
MLQIPLDRTHCTVLSKHRTGGEHSTDRDTSSGSGNDDDDYINRELLDDSYEQREPIEGGLVL